MPSCGRSSAGLWQEPMDGELDVSIRRRSQRLDIAQATTGHLQKGLADNQRRSRLRASSQCACPGSPTICSTEDACPMRVSAQERPGTRGRATTHWTQVDLAEEAVRRAGVCTPIFGARSVECPEGPSAPRNLVCFRQAVSAAIRQAWVSWVPATAGGTATRRTSIDSRT